MEEKWATLVYQGTHYDNYEIDENGYVRNKTTKHILKRRIENGNEKRNGKPYFHCDINLGKRKLKKRVILHRAVAETYIKNDSSFDYVVAKDGDYLNISIDNLYWSKYRKGDENHEKTKKRKRSNNPQAVAERRRKLKQMAVEYKGGKCIICGYNRCLGVLDFHHLDPNEKDFGIASSGTTRSWDALKKELDKCICVCANCHREIHNNYINLEDYDFTINKQ